MKILIADDDRILRRLLGAMAAEFGFEAIYAEDGLEAWEEISRIRQPMLAIVDWHMPGLSGPELCAKVRSQRQGEYCYIILLTGRDKSEDRHAALEAGANDFVTKPFMVEDLRESVRAAQRRIALQTTL